MKKNVFYILAMLMFFCNLTTNSFAAEINYKYSATFPKINIEIKKLLNRFDVILTNYFIEKGCTNLNVFTAHTSRNVKTGRYDYTIEVDGDCPKTISNVTFHGLNTVTWLWQKRYFGVTIENEYGEKITDQVYFGTLTKYVQDWL